VRKDNDALENDKRPSETTTSNLAPRKTEKTRVDRTSKAKEYPSRRGRTAVPKNKKNHGRTPTKRERKEEIGE